jgi:RNA polymerase sigma-70 factor (sigma-E family)
VVDLLARPLPFCWSPFGLSASLAATREVSLLVQVLTMAGVARVPAPAPAAATTDGLDVGGLDVGGLDVDAFVACMFAEHGPGLVRMVRLFVDDRNAAEDLVQEAFIRLARSAHRISDPSKAGAYLRSIVLNLARDNNRRGLVSLRHHLPFDDLEASVEDEVVLREDQQAVVDALRELPHRQRDCVILRYYDELGIDEIAATLGLSRNSVKTHLTRGLRALARHLGSDEAEADDVGSGPGPAAGGDPQAVRE